MPYPNGDLPLGQAFIMLTLDTHTHNHGKVIHHGKNNALAKKDNLQQKEQSFFFSCCFRSHGGVYEV